MFSSLPLFHPVTNTDTIPVMPTTPIILPAICLPLKATTEPNVMVTNLDLEFKRRSHYIDMNPG
ncbi:MAG: hypothetical protein HC930_11095 [Hydrococcus sp. SU_1_0]|nr:hypothetical protein [Hydrococcus sp. SU_1_0]